MMVAKPKDVRDLWVSAGELIGGLIYLLVVQVLRFHGWYFLDGVLVVRVSHRVCFFVAYTTMVNEDLIYN